MQIALVIIHVIIAVALTTIVLMQHGKQQGLSGAIAGGAETFFGKNKGRTIDAILKKVTAVFAILFIVSSITLTIVSINTYSGSSDEVNSEASSEAAQTVKLDENGNMVDENGNILMSAEDVKKAQEEQAAGQDGEKPAAENSTENKAE